MQLIIFISPDKRNSEKEILVNLCGPRFVHHFSEKWENGEGLTIFNVSLKYKTYFNYKLLDYKYFEYKPFA